MSQPQSMPPRSEPPSGRRLLAAALVATVLATIALVFFVLPIEYGIDVTGAGRLLGLTRPTGAALPALRIDDNLAGNESLRSTSESPKQLLLPNPAVHQSEAAAPKSSSLVVKLPPGGETEIKIVMVKNQVILYRWSSDRGSVYYDFHAHSPSWPDREAFVRYHEDENGRSSANGSLVAPFDGEHGWYWVNINDFPVTISLTIDGYYQSIRDYGVSELGG